MNKEFRTFREFYPYYLAEHNKKGTRITHFIGTSLFFVFIVLAIAMQQPWFILGSVIVAYSFAWIGHFFIEKNKPATFKYPWMSLKGDFTLYFEIWTGKEGFAGK